MDRAHLARYVDFELAEHEEIELENHLVDCVDCAEQIQRMRAYAQSWAVLSPEFSNLIRRMTALARAAEPAVDLPGSSADVITALARGLEAAVKRAEDVRDLARVARLQEWGRRVTAGARQAAQKFSRAVAGPQPFQSVTVEEFRELGWAWLQRIEPLALRSSGGLVREGSAHKMTPAPSGGPPGVDLRLEPIAGTRDVELVAKGLPPSTDRLLVLLISAKDPAQAWDAVLRQIAPSHDEWTARFREIPPGDYTLAIEPLGNCDRP